MKPLIIMDYGIRSVVNDELYYTIPTINHNVQLMGYKVSDFRIIQ